MLTDFRFLSPDDSLAHAVKLTLAGSQKDFPVVSDGSLVGVLTQSGLLQGLNEHGELARVDQVMDRDVRTADIAEPLERVLERLQSHRLRLLAVMDAGRLVGIVDLDNIMEMLKIHAALHNEPPGSAGQGIFRG
jgi:CBS domain-containing protein